jgi:hypothetical protein
MMVEMKVDVMVEKMVGRTEKRMESKKVEELVGWKA